MEGNKRVAVAVRVRPVLREGVSAQHYQEKFEMQGVYRASDTALRVELTKPDEPTRASTFTFDYIFDQESTQLEVYEDAVVDLVDAALTGASATVLAYGQTGSGKTFSVLGDVKPNPLENDLLTHESGLFLRVLSDLMDYKLRQAKRGVHVVIGLSCVEIYNESVRDLFGGKVNTAPPPLKAVMIGDDVFLPSLIIKEMTSLQGVFNEIQLAISRRQSRATDANATSSRSHCLFSIDILQQSATAAPPSLTILEQSRDQATMPKRQSVVTPQSPTNVRRDGDIAFNGTQIRIPGQSEPVFHSKIIIADLAGSERIAKTHVSGQGLAEATSINSSLTALGNVVHSLHEGGYVSYRVSNLTRLLKPSFSHPNSRVLLLAQVSPTQLTFDETVSSLHFANKVKAMKVTTVTGAEAEKLQFDFVEAEKTADILLADLHIWQVDQLTHAGVVHRKSTQNLGLYYDKAAKGKKWNPKERRAFLENVGAVRNAERERAEVQRLKDEEEAQRASKTKQAIAEEREKVVEEHKGKMDEAKHALAEAKGMRANNNVQMFQIDVSATTARIQAEEELEFAQISRQYMTEHSRVCKDYVNGSAALNEKLDKTIASLRTSGGLSDIPETAEDNNVYATAAWGHCVAKRFFASCMELREAQVKLSEIQVALMQMERWKKENKDAIDGTSSVVKSSP